VKAQLWFYTGTGRLFDKLIRLYTRSRYSHVELCINDLLYSADAWSGYVRCRGVGGFNPAHWEIVEVDVPPGVISFLGQQLLKRYDWLGIFGFFWFGVQNPSRWYCSELCARALGYTDNPVSPRKLYEIVTGIKNV
jgi:hypothetical protein